MEEQHSRRQQKIFRNVTLVQAGLLKKSRRPLPTIIGLLVTFAVMIAATWGAACLLLPAFSLGEHERQ